MTKAFLSEEAWEEAALETLGDLEWTGMRGPDVAPGSGERETWDSLVIPHRLRAAIATLNPDVPALYRAQAMAEILSPTSQDPMAENYRIHQFLTEGFRGVSYTDDDGQETTPTIRVLGPGPEDNDWLAVRQVRVRRGEYERRFDLVLYCNGLPVSVIELKQAGSQAADIAAAHAQLQTYLREFPMEFRFAVFTLASDGILARYGTPFTPLNHFAPWNVDDDGQPVEPNTDASGEALTGLEWALWGLYNQERFLQLLRSFTAFDGGDTLSKRIAKPHQYFAVTKAVGKTVEAVRSNGKAGVVWHTQGSGKSMEMELYANLVARRPELLNPTIVVVTDRTELDGQLYQTFARSRLLPEKPVQATRRDELRTALTERVTGGLYFTTLQKFGRTDAERQAGAEHPLLTDRRNVIVVVDEAHRSHYDDLDGYAHHLKAALPRATMIAFTGTPISFADRNTQAVFGDHIDVYDLTRAVADGATVPVYFEQRLVKVELAAGLTQEILDAAADEATVGLDDTERARAEAAVAVVNAVYGAPARLKVLAADIVEHWGTRREQMTKFLSTGEQSCPGKALIVGATRDICARLYAEIVALRPDWHSDDLAKGRIKVVYSGNASDMPPISDHVRRDSLNATLKQRLATPDDELELIIVKDMMLTGYDSPPLHTLYLDRPLKGALLMQTLARVNRTFRGKADGLLVAYAPLTENLTNALAEYTVTDQETKPVGRDIGEAVALTRTLIGELAAVVAGHDWKAALAKAGPRARINAVHGTVNHLRDPGTPGNQVPDGDPHTETLGARYRRLSAQLARSWALCSGTRSLPELHPEAQFYEEVRVWMAKFDAEARQASGEPVSAEIERMLAELIATSTATDGVLDIYAAAGMPRPTLSDLNPDFRNRAQQAPNPHLAIEALRALLTEESARATRSNVVRARAFSERLSELMLRYTNAQLSSAEVIAELVDLAREVAAEGARGAGFSPPLDTDELAFYDAVAQNESAVLEQGEDILAQIARELVEVMRRDVRTDWTVRDDVRAKLRSSIKRLLVKHGYPPDQQPAAIKLVLEQMESLAPRFAQERE